MVRQANHGYTNVKFPLIPLDGGRKVKAFEEADDDDDDDCDETKKKAFAPNLIENQFCFFFKGCYAFEEVPVHDR